MFFYHKPEFKKINSEIVIKAKKDGSLSVKEIITLDNSVATMTLVNKGDIELREITSKNSRINGKR